MKQFETTRNLINTHKKKRARKNVFKILMKQLSSEQMQIIQNCNISIVKILREMLDKMKQEEINRIAELIFLIIEQRVLHSRREINIKLLLMTIDIFLITNHIIEVRKIRVTKKILNKNEYDIEHLRLRRIVKKMMMRDENEKKKKNENLNDEENDEENANSK